MVKISLFSQMLSLIPRDKFERLVFKHGSDKHQKGISFGTRNYGPIGRRRCFVISATQLLCGILATATRPGFNQYEPVPVQLGQK